MHFFRPVRVLVKMRTHENMQKTKWRVKTSIYYYSSHKNIQDKKHKEKFIGMIGSAKIKFNLSCFLFELHFTLIYLRSCKNWYEILRLFQMYHGEFFFFENIFIFVLLFLWQIGSVEFLDYSSPTTKFWRFWCHRFSWGRMSEEEKKFLTTMWQTSSGKLKRRLCLILMSAFFKAAKKWT